jgi:hypothetical protein
MATQIVFPTYIRSEAGKYQFISLSTRDGKDKSYEAYSIFLPIPPGFQLNDNGDYGTIDGAAIDAIGAVQREGADLKVLASLAKIGAAQVASKIQGADIAQFALKKIKAPNTNTTFTGNSVREFSFQFNFIPRNKADTEAIRQIRAIFQKFTYGGAENSSTVLLSYPPVWKIQFMNGDGSENQYFPKVYASYLKSVNTTVNPNSSAFHTDGSPIETQITLSFQESRSLTRYDITRLENANAAFTRGIDPETGLATIKD